MELMSSLLFCVFATILPHLLGREIKIRKTIENFPVLSKPTYTMRNKVLIKSNPSPILKRHDSLLLSVEDCSQCIYCMTQAVKESKRKFNVMWRIPHDTDKGKRQAYNNFVTRKRKDSTIGFWSLNRTRVLLFRDKSLRNNFLTVSPPKKHFGVRIKRRSIPVTTTEKIKLKEKRQDVIEKKEIRDEWYHRMKEENNLDRTEKPKEDIKEKKEEDKVEVKKEDKKEDKKKVKQEKKEKKEGNKGYKFASVIKYRTNGMTYALKINETKFDNKGGVQSACFVYKVINTYECGSNEERLLLSAEHKNSKSHRNKATSRKEIISTTYRTLHKKETREVSTPHDDLADSILETSFLPSVEESY